MPSSLQEPPDRGRPRLAWGILASVAVNAAFWPLAARMVHSPALPPPPPITFRRIILPTPKKVARPIVKPKPLIVHKQAIFAREPIAPPPPIPVPPLRLPQRPVPAAHQHIVTAKGPTAAIQTALPGGHASVGQPMERQHIGEERDVPPVLPPAPTSPPTLPSPEPQPEPIHQALPPPAPAAPKPPPAPAGPTQDAQPGNQMLPKIPDELLSEDFQTYVRVKVEIAVDGSSRASLVTSSGNREMDRRILDALKHWKWKPALKEGHPIASTSRFRFDFEVQ